MPQQQTIEDLGKLVKSKYPDAYGQLPDIEVGRKVKAKYPQYSQFADMPTLQGVQSGHTVPGITPAERRQWIAAHPKESQAMGEGKAATAKEF